MTDKELADKVVALGVGGKSSSYGDVYHLPGSGFGSPDTTDSIDFVRDWRVAGALMEKCASVEIDTIGNPWWVAAYALKRDPDGHQLPERWFKSKGDNLPRAIIEACVEALSD